MNFAARQAIEQLDAVEELLSNPGNWTQGSYARDEDGYDLDNPLDPNATCWCLEGALRKVCGFDHLVSVLGQPAWEALYTASFAYGGPVQANDDGGYDVVMRMIVDAKVELEKEQ